MLGRKSFTFETPNVIDPGEQAPSRPARKEALMDKTMEKQPPTDNSPSSERRLSSYNTTVLLDAKNGIDNISVKPPQETPFAPRYSFSSGSSNIEGAAEYESDDDDSIDAERQAFNAKTRSSVLNREYGEMDDDEFDRAVHDQLPSVEDARIFAATILQETDRRSSGEFSPRSFARKDRSLKSFFASRGINRGTSTYNIQGGLIQTVPLSRSKRACTQNCRNWLMRVVLATILIVFIVAVLSAVRNRPHHGAHSSERFNAMRTFVIEQEVSTESNLSNPKSPQSLAAKWIADRDVLNLSIPDGTQGGIDAVPLLQRYALVVIYFALGGENWKDSMNFLTEQHECGWFRIVEGDFAGGLEDGRSDTDYYYDQTKSADGVICDDNLRVRNLIIPRNNLVGFIPDEIKTLDQIDVINFASNMIYGEFPENIESLQRLRYLDLNYNRLVGFLPTSLGHLSNLEILGLSHNAFEGEIPESMAFLTNMETLAIDNNLLTGDIAPLYGMKRIKYLYADHNGLEADNNLLEPFSGLNDLVELDLCNNDMRLMSEGFLPEALFNRPNLKVLDLSRNKLGGMLPEELPLNNKLEFLSLRNSMMEGTIPKSISNLRALTHLDLEINAFNGDMPSAIGAIEGLTYLFLGRNPFYESQIPPQFGRLVNLRELSLDGTKRVGRLESGFVNNWPKLKLLDVRNNKMAGEVPEDIGKLTSMTFLMLSNNSFTGDIPDAFHSMDGLAIVALHNNDLTGDVSNILCRDGDKALDVLTTDCSKVTCSCCSKCCEEGDEECYGDLVWDRLEYHSASWTENYSRSSYSFDPKMLERDYEY